MRKETDMERRKFLYTLGLIPLLGGLDKLHGITNSLNFTIKNRSIKTMAKFELPKLPYAYDALEPYIDARTMEIHHSKHHAGYTNNLNNAIPGTAYEGKEVEELFMNAKTLPAA